LSFRVAEALMDLASWLTLMALILSDGTDTSTRGG